MSISSRTVRFLRILSALALAVPLTAYAATGTIDSTNKYAWGENIGWINFATGQSTVTITDTALTGYAWGENIGWISLNCSNTSSCATVDYSVTNDGTGRLGGYAWGENVGWISFSAGPVIIADGGDFTGYAWGENVGWISFNCSNTSSCATVSYKVASSYDPGSGGGGSSGGAAPPGPIVGGSPTPTPSPTVSPTESPTPSPIPGPMESLTPSPIPTAVPPPVTAPPSAPPPPEGIEPPGPPPAAVPPSSGFIPEPITEVITQVGNVLDGITETVIVPAVEAVIEAVQETCGTFTGAPACASTAVVVIPAAAAAAAAAAAPAQVQATAQWFFHAIGLKRRPRTWGVVYDSATKRPIPGVRVELLDALGRVLETQFSDRDGRYGFLAKPTSLEARELRGSIRARRDGYRFPSSSSIAGTDYIVYENVYRGGEIVVPLSSQEVVRFNIPLDPLPEAMLPAGSLRILGAGLGERLLEIGFFVGLVTVPAHYFLMPNTRNLVVMIVFFGANLLRFSALYRPYGLVYDSANGKRLAFALVTLEDQSGKRVGFAVSDEFGRFILKGERGQQYRLTVYTPANIAPQRSISQQVVPGSWFMRSAWVTSKLRV